jgi:hypothetical protein
MTIRMDNLEGLTLAEMEEMVANNRHLGCEAMPVSAAYPLIERVLKRQQYRKLSKGQRGVVLRFLAKVVGRSRAQMTRLVRRWMDHRCVEPKLVKRACFARRYTVADTVLLAKVDAAHEDLSGPAVLCIMGREFRVYNKPEYERLAGISVSHIYNLRRSEGYRKIRVKVQRTQGRQVSIAERRKPDPKGRPGYLRVDTVHQGNQDGKAGLFHINAVDTVTQWEVVGCVETIAESHLLPVLEAILHQFPFRILGFHCDNGSEFINHLVVDLLNKLLVQEFTKSRAYRTTDNALVEGKNGAVVRKHIGHGGIEASHAEEFQKFYTASFNPYLNYHRPCGFATVTRDRRGRRQRRYRAQDYQTPYEKLTSLADWHKHLKPGIKAELLERESKRMSDTEAAQRMQKEKLALLANCRTPRRSPGAQR